MSILNGYCTLADFKAFITPPGQELSVDMADDAFIDDVIMTASRRVDDLLGRTFYPRIETYHYDIPDDNVIWFDDDLLEVLTFTNGDDTVIASTQYILKPTNTYPKYMLKMRDISTTTFVMDSNSSSEEVLDVTAIMGFHEWYDHRAWILGGTLSAAWASTSTLSAAITLGHTLENIGGQVIRIDNEILNTQSVTTVVLNVLSRGDNGSTAATHLINAPVYYWKPMEPIKKLAMAVAQIDYKARYGENIETTAITTSAGVIITPRSLPVSAQEVIRKYQRIV